MREHLFKGFHPDENSETIITFEGIPYRGNWVEGSHVFGGENHYIVIRNGLSNQYIEVIPETVSEYAGLLDKNHKRIFENHVIKATINLAGEICYAKGVVIFENGTFKLKVFQSKNTTEYKQYTDANATAYSLEHNFIERHYLLEVIGNIYDTPTTEGV